MNISMKEAQSRLRRGKCMNCGLGDITSVELSSCNDPKCVKALRPVYRWAKNLASIIADPVQTTYSQSIRHGGKHVT